MREQGYGTDRAAGQHGRTTVAPGRTEVLDLDLAAELLGLGDGLDDVVATFSGSVPQRLEEMWTVARAGDAAGVARAARAVRGVGACVAAGRLAAACEPVEQIASAGELPSVNALAGLYEEYELAQAALQTLISARG